jgi:hypothetical protein
MCVHIPGFLIADTVDLKRRHRLLIKKQPGRVDAILVVGAVDPVISLYCKADLF